MNYRLSQVADKSVLFVMAASPEYGPHLQARIAPLMTGIGPVEAAIAVTAVLAGLDAADHLPDLVVSLGSAGSRTLEQTGIYQATSVSYRDMDASAFGFEKGCTPLLDLPAEVALPLRVPEIAEARLSTGANVVSGAAYGLIDADMVEMETFAILRACQRFGVPLIGLRGISDGKADVNHVDDWTEYLHIIDEKLADAVDRLCRAIEDGAIAL
ncbi:5'-methylthioadenosine/S-adenosylhomocysteine nucleosidase [Agrobacterium tumefaciens]|uniref:5'-methylthioadenosine/S-adenosylhomocysteine nucleosidase n=1 Tax=Agrobacterium tumefaciens TaxID=358 RepID=UPI00045A9779|nr:5'-methylthioadenosine/S-adenosylhomocysteine nucleosidase [Agrobacterium tumefaciens]CDN91938.1 5'-methylthioadenosine/S-adenosylhomocysteine nucleosidase [Agrobacterium tumefaciens]